MSVTGVTGEERHDFTTSESTRLRRRSLRLLGSLLRPVRVRVLLDSGINQLVQGVLYMTFTAVALFLLDGTSGLVLFAALLPLALLSRWFQVRAQTLLRQSRTASASLIVHFVETMTGIRAVKAFRKEKRNEQQFGRLVEDYRSVNARVIQLFGVFDPGLVLIGNVTVAVVLLVGAFRVVDGSLAIGALLYTRRFFDPMEEMAMFYNSYQAAAAALEKISGVLKERSGVPDPVVPVDLREASGNVQFDGVQFAYKTDRVILSRFDLNVPAGQTIALVGLTGAGKSTLAKLMSRFYDPSEGRVLLDGVDLRDLHPKDLRRAIIMVTQEAYLFSGSVADNIAIGKPDATLAEIAAAAKAVGAHGFIESLPMGYDTDVHKRGGRISEGQRQLISFARAFLANPAVLILDEATSSLDIPSERLVQEALQTLLSDRTAASGTRVIADGAERDGGARGGWACRRALQLNEDGVGFGVADVLAGMILGRQPPHTPGRHLDVNLVLAGGQPPAEGTERDHHAVRMVVWSGLVPGLVAVLQNAHALVLHDDAVETGVRDDRIAAHGRSVTPPTPGGQ
ncbi:ABC transporter ATP-binding protein [Cryobacterium psychrophilum]|uniref:ABC transporter ATP-binding protein n=1 Tax=Cryobacterium psychrophilum TaxID=41988 RepID=UPI0010D3E279|nr:ABC transporter ATP-binding protein [Cryobacterium psychrophilum]TDW29585.1 ABC-type multidrug transport system fused ATPase/permease subunit [Cryobacterium psychrophilum]